MRVRTEQAQTFDLSLSGAETQESINFDKYVELAYGSPHGARLALAVEEHWNEWVATVNIAPWLRGWRKSLYCALNRPAGLLTECTPMGHAVSCGGETRIALALYIEMVWGFGVLRWQDKLDKARNPATTKILQMQNLKKQSTTRTYFCDEAVYRGTGLYVPAEFHSLDQWLENLWYDTAATPDK